MAEGGYQSMRFDSNRRKYNRVCRYFLNGVCNKGEACQYLHVTSRQVETQYVSPDSYVTSRQVETQYVSPDSFYEGCTCGGGCRPVRGSLQTDRQPSLRPSVSQNQRPVYSGPSNLINSTAMNEDLVPEERRFAWNALLPSLTPEMSVYEFEIEERFHRGLCPLNSFGRCPSKEHCVNLHGDVCNVCKMPRLHPIDHNQRESHYRECLAVHQRQSIDKECGICLENVMEKEGLDPERRFGLLENCNHSFCMSCIEQWRSTLDEMSARHRTCPMCRSHSDLMLPCQYWIECPDEKKQRMLDYKDEHIQQIVVFRLLRLYYVLCR